ncbi:hypothetical protein AN960_05795 [Bacillus sp. FJAT-25509]|uniref:helix-turn-helix transcriptional regulator n=1 Tax=Bacillaceae TaxID=186817 RepID=UPI0006F520F5|nr:helix-turn-helix transcriptional regulator [Bacillus sp. FJAT-25509]KQL41088.1 hypothetical protein AN960_05795 [Bacillus sp. FJAT-25509]
MSIGKIIYYHRKKQHMTQEQLCHGICSATHLSKIENNSKEANIKTLQKLCERLEISMEEETKKTQLLKQKLDLFYDAMERLHKEKAATLYDELMEHKEFVQCIEIIYLYELYMLRYLLYLDRYSEFEEESLKMKKDVPKYSSYELFVWRFLKAIYYGRTQKYAQALNILNKLEEQAEQYSERITDYYYYRSTTHGHMFQYSLSIDYANKALAVFQDKNNILRIMHIKIIMAVNLIYIGEFNRAEQMLDLILSDADLLQDITMKAMALHNLGYLHQRQGNVETALDFFSQSLKFKQKYTHSYYLTISTIADMLIQYNQHEKALELLKPELDYFQDDKSSNYIKLKILYLEATRNKKKLVKYLIKHVPPRGEQNVVLNNGIKYFDMIIAYYEEKNEITTAYHYLKISNQFLKKLLHNLESPLELENLKLISTENKLNF